MKKFRFLILALAIIMALMPLSLVKAQENADWQYNSQTGILENNGTIYVPFNTVEYNVAIDKKIGKVQEADTYGDSYVYSVKNEENNDLVFLYNYYGDYCVEKDSVYCYAGFAMLFCKESKVEEYTEQLKNFTPGEKYCLVMNNNIATEIEDDLMEELLNAPQTKVRYNDNQLNNSYYQTYLEISMYDEKGLFFSQIGTIYVDSSSEERYFCDYREIENVNFSFGNQPAYGFSAMASLRNITGEAYTKILAKETSLSLIEEAIRTECSPNDQTVLVSSTSLADVLVIVAVIVLLYAIPLFVAVLGIIKLLRKNGSKLLWIPIVAIALSVIIITSVIIILMV